jgi:hypothetical protein
MNPFWIGGSLLFIWALFLAFALGLRSEGFPRTDGQMKAVIGVSVALTLVAISSAIIGASAGLGEGKGVRHGAEAPAHSE